ncbi:MAG: 16S rRNA (uracil(1498)-N(3))-methyltransferase [Muribaculaceae bacterium]|nr:16S rRNA (uracil(1498)-N(3))-methyltransferase [Muribaculaceae bacterium]
MIRFYAPDINQSTFLPESDSQHCCRVLRMQAGDCIEIVDGRGALYKCRIAMAHNKRTEVEIIERIDLPPVWQYNITVAVAPTKHLDRMEWLVEKLVEIGVNRIVPIRCMRSERKELKTERLEKIAVSAMKQSLKAVVPRIDEMMSLQSFLTSVDKSDQRFVAYCDDWVERRLLAREYRPGSSVTVLIGPEGDFSPEEIKMTIDDGFVPVTLGDNRLRTETAALVACDTFHIINQAFQK